MSRCVSILAASSIATVTDDSPAGKILSSDEDASTKRVSQLLSSKDFRSQLEKLTQNHPSKPDPNIFSLPGTHTQSSAMYSCQVSGPLIPINDIGEAETPLVSREERNLRCKLASVYRLIDIRGWANSMCNNITVKLRRDDESHYLVSPFGLASAETTAGSLVKVDLQGRVAGKSNTPLSINKATYLLHAAIHAARPDIGCIIQIDAPATVAVASMRQGLLACSQPALHIGRASYHDYQGSQIDEREIESLCCDLGPINKVMFLRNRGAVVCGTTIEEAWSLAVSVVNACKNQVAIVSAGLSHIMYPSQEALERVLKNNDAKYTSTVRAGDVEWAFGELEFETQMRALDFAGFNTGYNYKLPSLKVERKVMEKSQVESLLVTLLSKLKDDEDKKEVSSKEASKGGGGLFKRMGRTDGSKEVTEKSTPIKAQPEPEPPVEEVKPAEPTPEKNASTESSQQNLRASKSLEILNGGEKSPALDGKSPKKKSTTLRLPSNPFSRKKAERV